MPELDAFEKNPVECDEYRHLYEHRQTAAKRIDLLFFIQLHGGLLHFYAVVAVVLFKLLHLRHHPAHTCH